MQGSLGGFDGVSIREISGERLSTNHRAAQMLKCSNLRTLGEEALGRVLSEGRNAVPLGLTRRRQRGCGPYAMVNPDREATGWAGPFSR